MQKQSQVHHAVDMLKHSNNIVRKERVKQTVQKKETGTIYLFSNIKSAVIENALICCLWIYSTKTAAGPVYLFDYV